MTRFAKSSALAVLLLGFFAADVCAHAIGVDCTVRLGKIEVEAFYDDDSAAQKAKVELVNAKNEVVAHAVTDQLGRCTLPLPAPGAYEVRVDAGAGHRAKKKIEVPAPVVDPTTNATPAAVSVGDGPSRAEFTRFPWEKMLIGFVAISALSGAFVLGTFIRKKARARGEG